MRVMLFGGMAAIISIGVLCGCGPEPAASPITPAGELPDLFTAIADGEYLAVGYLDIESGLRSGVGKVLLTHLEQQQQWMGELGISLGELVREVGFAVRFDSRSYPNFYRSLRLIAVVRTGLDDAALQQLLDTVPHQIEEIGGVNVHRLAATVPGLASGDSFWLAMPRPGLLLFTTYRDLLVGSLAALEGNHVSLKNGESLRTLLDKVDKESTGWLAIRHSVRSRNLLQFLAPFDDCIAQLDFAEDMSILCVLEFNVEEEARIAVDGFKLSRRQMKDFADYIPEQDDPRTFGGKVMLEVWDRFEARQEGKLAVFSAKFDARWFQNHWPQIDDNQAPTGDNVKEEQ